MVILPSLNIIMCHPGNTQSCNLANDTHLFKPLGSVLMTSLLCLRLNDSNFLVVEQTSVVVKGPSQSLGPGNMAASGLSCRKPLISPGWAISLLCTNGLRKQFSGNVGPSFLAVRPFSRSSQATVGQET